MHHHTFVIFDKCLNTLSHWNKKCRLFKFTKVYKNIICEKKQITIKMGTLIHENMKSILKINEAQQYYI